MSAQGPPVEDTLALRLRLSLAAVEIAKRLAGYPPAQRRVILAEVGRLLGSAETSGGTERQS